MIVNIFYNGSDFLIKGLAAPTLGVLLISELTDNQFRKAKRASFVTQMLSGALSVLAGSIVSVVCAAFSLLSFAAFCIFKIIGFSLKSEDCKTISYMNARFAAGIALNTVASFVNIFTVTLFKGLLNRSIHRFLDLCGVAR